MYQKNTPYYKYSSLGSISALALALRVEKDRLIEIAKCAREMYRVAQEIKKNDGTIRVTYDAYEPLKTIQEKIKSRFLLNVEYPRYLQGAIKDREHPRDYIRDAQFHTGCATIINEDVCNFFPSIKSAEVYKLWKYFFNFPHEVADCLTKLTTLNNTVPQGGKCSSYIANLIFWDIEYKIQEKMRAFGLTYSRFVDDITLSSRKTLPNTVKSKSISSLYGMFYKKGLAPKRDKHRIVSSHKPMTVYGLNVNSKNYPSISKSKRSQIRAAVHQCEMIHKGDYDKEIYRQRYQSIIGRVGTLKRLHKTEGEKLHQRLRAIKPEEDVAGLGCP